MKVLLLKGLLALACCTVPVVSRDAIRGGSTRAAAKPGSANAPVQPLEPFRTKKDSVERFVTDVATVMNVLRADKHDPTVASMFNSETRPTFAITWNHKMWEEHTSRWRFLGYWIYWYKSALLKRIVPQLSVLMLWTYAAIYLTTHTQLANINFPMTSLSLVSGFVASLIGLRTSQGMSRLLEARQAFGKVVFYTRDMASLVSNFIYDKDPQLALKLARHLATFSWLLKNFLRGKAVTGSDEDLIRTMLPNKADADYVVNQRKMPVAVVMRLRQALAHCTHKHLLSTAEEIAIDHAIQSMDLSIMVTERIIASPIPPLFTSHAGRLMSFYLAFLPVALKSSGTMNTMGVFLTVFAVGYAMFGLDEISHLMEQPFKICPLYDLCRNSMRDVTDAFFLRPPALNDSDAFYPTKVAPYWAAGEEFDSTDKLLDCPKKRAAAYMAVQGGGGFKPSSMELL